MIRVLLIIFLLFSARAHASARAASAITGFWRVQNGAAVVHIQRHGQHYRGRLVWLKHGRQSGDGETGKPLSDRHNPDAAKRQRPLLGLTLLTGLTYAIDDGHAVWRNGHIYNTENGKRYRCSVRLVDSGHLKLHGYIGTPLFGSTTTWGRVADPRNNAR